MSASPNDARIKFTSFRETSDGTSPFGDGARDADELAEFVFIIDQF